MSKVPRIPHVIAEGNAARTLAQNLDSLLPQSDLSLVQSVVRDHHLPRTWRRTWADA